MSEKEGKHYYNKIVFIITEIFNIKTTKGKKL